MKKFKFSLLLASLGLAILPPLSAGTNTRVLDYLSGLTDQPAVRVEVSSPSADEGFLSRYENPPCVPSQALLPGKGFVPVVSDARRVQAIDDLLAKIAVCKPMPYGNDGNVHSKPHPGLPQKPSGYYKEYTLIVPNRPTGSPAEPVVIGGVTYMAGPVESFRGAERLLIGNGTEVYYTPDHYTTFIRLDIQR